MRLNASTITLCIAIGLRLLMFSIPGLSSFMTNRVEISTPVCSFKRLTESMFLIDQGMSPYSGDAFHQPPLILLIFYPLRKFDIIYTQLIFIAVDVLISITLKAIINHRKSSSNNDSFILKNLSDVVAGCYLLNPFSVFSCIGMSSVTFTHACSLLSILCAMDGYIFWTSWFLAIAVYLDVFPILLIAPLVILIEQARNKDNVNGSSFFTKLKIRSLIVCTFTLSVAGLLYLSFLMFKDWSFMWESYGFNFMVQDFTPNIGIFWYFHTEMFERFFNFFLATFHSLIFFYAPPLTIRFYDKPLFLAWCLCAIPSVFKPYPVVGDIAFALVFLLVNLELILKKMRRIYPLVYFLIQSAVGGILMWFLWIYPGSGNANFFYFQSLVFSLCVSFIITEAITAVRRLDADCTHGLSKTEEKISTGGKLTDDKQ